MDIHLVVLREDGEFKLSGPIFLVTFREWSEKLKSRSTCGLEHHLLLNKGVMLVAWNLVYMRSLDALYICHVF